MACLLMTFDILITEKGDGGDMVLRGNDLVVVTGVENQPYLGMFGGPAADEADWWGNELFMQGQTDNQFHSETEKALRNVLTSSTRIQMEQAAKGDIDFLKKAFPGMVITVTVAIVSDNRLEMQITLDGRSFYIEWNPDTSFLTYRL